MITDAVKEVIAVCEDPDTAVRKAIEVRRCARECAAPEMAGASCRAVLVLPLHDRKYACHAGNLFDALSWAERQLEWVASAYGDMTPVSLQLFAASAEDDAVPGEAVA